MLAFRRRMIDHGAVAVQQFGQDILPLLLLFAISVTGLMLTASYTWMRGYAYEFLAILHAATVIVTLLWLPFGKLFHVFQRPAQLGVGFYKDAGARGAAGARAGAAGRPYASQLMVRDLDTVEQELGFRYEIAGRRALPGRLPQVPARALRPGAGRVVAAVPERRRGGRQAGSRRGAEASGRSALSHHRAVRAAPVGDDGRRGCRRASSRIDS